MIIRLNEIPAEGREYKYDRESGELDVILEDLIHEADYDVDLMIRPIGNAFEVRGKIDTSVPEICSHCGYDFTQTIHRKVNEILFEDQTEDRKGHSVHGNQSVDFLSNGPSMTPYRDDLFNVGEFVHEAIALDEPFYPTCGPNGSCEHEAEVAAIKAKLDADFAKGEEEEKKNPFAVLQGLHLEDAKN